MAAQFHLILIPRRSGPPESQCALVLTRQTRVRRQALRLIWDEHVQSRQVLHLQWDREMTSDRQALRLIYAGRIMTGTRRGLRLIWGRANQLRRGLHLWWDAAAIVRQGLYLRWDLLPLPRQALRLIWDMQPVARQGLRLVWDAKPAARQGLRLTWDAKPAARQALRLIWDGKPASRQALRLIWDGKPASRQGLRLIWDGRPTARQALRLRWGATPVARQALRLTWSAEHSVGGATTVTIAGQPVSPIALRVTEDADQVAITAVLEFAEPLPAGLGPPAAVIIEIMGIRYELVGESYSRSREFGARSWTLTAASPAYRLQGRYAEDVDVGPSGLTGMASGVARTLAAGIPLDWRMVDWELLPLRFAPGSRARLDALRDLVSAAGGALTSDRDGLLVAQPWPPHRPDQWPGLVALDLDSERALISLDDSPDERALRNAVTVADETASQGGLRIEEDRDRRVGVTTEVLVYQIPWQDDFDVRHVGDPRLVVLRDLGVEERVIEDELLEIVDGQGRTRYPIYGLVAARWNKVALGGITPAEDGTITTEIPAESLLYLTYRTRARRLFIDMGEDDPEPLMIVVED